MSQNKIKPGQNVTNLRGTRFGVALTCAGPLVTVLWADGRKSAHISAELQVVQGKDVT